MARAPKSLMEHAYTRSEGSTFNRFKESGRVVALVISWAMAQDELGVDDLRPEPFKDWAESLQSRATTERQLQAFRRVFKGEQTPNRLANELRRIAAERGEDLDATMDVSGTLLAA